MTFLVRIHPVTGNAHRVTAVLMRLLGPDSADQAKQLVKNGGIVTRDLNRPAAAKIAAMLEQAGVRASVEPDEERPGGALQIRVREPSGAPLADAKVTLHPEGSGAPVASARTDSEGRASIEDFGRIVAERFPRQRPAIGARVEREGKELEAFHKPFDWNAFQAGGYVFIVGARLPETEAPSHRVHGTVTLPSGEPAAGYRVRAEDRDLRAAELLGEVPVDGQGRYEIEYLPKSFGRDEQGRADLHLRVFTNTGRELPAEMVGREIPTVQGKQILFNAGRDEEANLRVAAAGGAAGISRYEALVAALSPLPGGLTLAELTADDAVFLHHDTGRGLDEIAFAADDARLSRDTGLPTAVLFGLALRGLGVVQPDPAGGREAPGIDLDALLREETDTLVKGVGEALEAQLIPAELAARQDSIRARLEELKGTSRLADTPQGLRQLRELAGARPGDAKVDQPVKSLLRDRAVAEVRRQLDASLASAPERARDAVKAVNLRALDPDADVRTAVIAELEARDDVAPEVVREVKTGLAGADLAGTLAGVVQPDLPLGQNPLLADDIRRARLVRVGEIAGLPEDRLSILLDRGRAPREISDEALVALTDQGSLAEEEARALGFTADLHRLLDEDDRLTEAFRGASFDALPGGRLRTARDLARLTPDDVESVVTQAEVELPAGVSPRDFARRLAVRFETLFPDEALFHRTLPNGGATEELRGDDERVRRFANTFAGLGVKEILGDPELDAGAKLQRVEKRLGDLRAFREANAGVNLLSVDLTPGGAGRKSLAWGDVAPEDRPGVLETVKSFQRVYAVSPSASQAAVLLGAGYDSALRIAGTSFDSFLADTGLDPAAGTAIRARAQATTGYVTSIAGSVLDIVRGGFDGLGVGNFGPSISDYLREIDGYEDLFGSLDFCSCDHCQSILGPAAYFADLMLFVEQHVLDKHFDGGDSGNVLNLKVRRPDLWTLALTCEHTNTLLPTLVIVNEVLENYIAGRRGFGGDLAVGSGVDRSAVEDFVYREHLANTTSSFEQPFLLPLYQLSTYLGHFDRSRHDVAVSLGAAEPVRTRARLGLSAREYELVTTPDATTGFLEKLYDLDFDVTGTKVDAFDAQELLGPTGLTRKELGRLIATTFVSPSGAAPVEIRSEKRDADSVQNDIERIHNLTLSALDRMHRFTRLWRVLPWSIEELDLVAEALAGAGLGNALDADTLRHAAALLEVQERLDVPVEESIALWTGIPRRAAVESGESLFARLFNPVGFAGGAPSYPQPGTRFVHPAWQTGSDTEHLHRLVAGLRVSDEDLYALIVNLAEPLGVDLTSADPADRGFALTETNLSLLYRHARLAEHLDLTVAELFQLLSFVEGIGGGHVASLDHLTALLDGYDRWEASPYPLDDLGQITGGMVLDPEAYPDPAEVATLVVEAADQDGALTFADTLFAYLEDVSEEDSRAILAANPGATVRIPESDLYRLADDFDVTAAINVPAGIALGEADARDVLVAHHVSNVLPTYLAAQLGETAEKTQALLDLAGADLHSDSLAVALRGGAPEALVELVAELQPLRLLFAPSALEAADVEFAATHPDLLSLNDLAALTPEAAWRVAAYRRLLTRAIQEQEAEAARADLQSVLPAHDGTDFAAADPLALARLFDTEDGLVATLRAALDLSGAAVHALERLGEAVELAQYLGVGGEALRQVVSEDYATLALARDAVLGAFRAKYGDEQTWLETVEPFTDKINARRRDALVDYLLHAVHPEFDEARDLYHHFLVDVEIASCARTSRVVEATASLQLYVHRCLMNLEQNARPAGDPEHVHVLPQDVPGDEWTWRKNYRVWEANRKVFLYPETYIEPELRDNKTPLFEELESTLLQREIDEQAVLDAYAQYVRGFEEVARLQIAGAYHDEGSDTDVLHLFGVTASDPPVYYYRTIENLILSEEDATRGVVYGPWRKLDVQIPVRRASPVVFRGTLYLFWVEIASRSKTDFEDGESRFLGYNHTFKFRYTSRRLDGTWTPPQALDLSAYDKYPFEAGDGVLFEHLSGDVPYYDTRKHYEPRDGYTLTGSRFDRLYPDPHEDGSTLYLTGVTYKLHAAVDFYANSISGREGSYVNRAVRWTGSIERGKLITVREHGDHYDLHVSTPGRHLFDDYAYASVVADSRRMDAAELNWDSSLTDDLRDDLYQRFLAKLPAPGDVMVVNGAVSDLILDVGGDILYVQGSAREGERALVRRLGTTISEDIGRTLVTRGVAGLLDLDAQRAFQEIQSPLYDLSGRLEDAVNAGELDLTGPYGVYYRELFFHVPFLIADHLNSQQRFAEAQKWYHYLFDPTAPVEDPAGGEDAETAVRDRPWRYLEFRGLNARKLRDQLTDAAAIETYEKDPFNPHAIARIRLSAYQKAVVMKYIDNLIDWGDALFAQDTRESITEATLHYVTAADILGDRPAELGSCGEGKVSPKTYERIGPLLREGSPFLAELEHFTLVYAPLLAASVPEGQFTLGVSAVQGAKRTADRKYARTYGGPTGKRAALRGAAAMTDAVEAAAAAERGDGVGGVVKGGQALVYRADWARTNTATWQSPGTPLARTGGTTLERGSAASPVTRSGLEIDEAIALGRGTKLGTHVRPDLLDNLLLPSFGISFLRQVSPVFCVPPNTELEAYWDRVEDRLYKIRHCMNISGVRRQLALFAPPIDPRLLVRARAAGLSLEDALGLTAGELPPYRFSALIGRAKAYAQTVQSFGGALLSALEKKDGEELARLRLVHQENLAKLTTQVRTQEVDAAAKALEGLQKRKATVEYRQGYYQALVGGRSGWEIAQSISRHTAGLAKSVAVGLDTAAGIAHLIPEVGAPTSLKYGGKQSGDSLWSWADLARDIGAVADEAAASFGLEAGFHRRDEGWQHQADLAGHELEELDRQIEAATIRWEIAVEQLGVHERSIEQVQEVFDFYGDKFTGLGLYTLLSSALQRLYREAYNSALAMARLAEQAFRFERNGLTDVALSANHWVASRAGLLAGEQLLLELQAMERRFIETDDRRLEIDQAFSLQQIDPAKLIRLKQEGECEFTIPERYFDLFYPGQYRRTIQAVRLTIPCVTGPYTNVSATLTLLDSEMRMDPDPAAAPVPSPRSRTTTVATSTGQNDAGVFEFSFRSERYMPFEGAGAVNSRWRLSLPRSFRPFDYDTINDVNLRISYTAELDGVLRDHVETENAAMEGTLTKVLKEQGLARALRLRHEFSTTFHRLLQAGIGESVPFEITEQHFPLYVRGRALVVKRALLALQLTEGAAAGTLEIALDGTAVSGFAALPELGGLPGVSLGAAFSGDPRGSHTLEVRDSGDLAPDAGAPPALDTAKIEDVVLYIEYGLDA